MSFTVVIPARFASTRLPGKPLLDINGQPMVVHVYQQACKSAASRVIVATDDTRIADAVANSGAEVCMTSAEHPSGTDRLQEVATLCGFAEEEIIVNVQGDEPLIPPSVINQVADNLAHNQQAGIATLCERMQRLEEVFNPNAVKVVFDQQGYALYFSRAPIPWDRDAYTELKEMLANLKDAAPDSAYYRHIGIYAYRVGFLHDYVQWPVSRLEHTEKLEQLRAMDNGVRIHVAPACELIPAGVDTEADLQKVRQIIQARAGN